MRIIKHNEDWLLVEVPVGSDTHHMATTSTDKYVKCWVELTDFLIKLPDNQTYTPIGLAPTLSEEQAGEVVEREDMGYYVDYEGKYDSIDFAVNSLKSLCSHHSIPFENCLIVKTEKK